MNLSYHDIARATGANHECADGTASRISTDSRDITPGCVFVALEGERYDGHDYVGTALEKGAAVAVVSKLVNVSSKRLLHVTDTRQALLDIARLHRMRQDVKVVAITGSVGKTTTKELTACVCGAGFHTLKTEQNLNNEIGLSHTIFRLDGHGAAVLEIAMDGPGQIAPMSRAAAPNAAIVTNIGVTHLEKLGTREAIRNEKLSIRAGLADGGTLILNGDDVFLKSFTDNRLNIIRYSLEKENSTVFATKLVESSTGTSFQIRYNGELYAAGIPTPGKHNVLNALAAFAAGVTFGVKPRDAANALGSYSPAGMRQRIVNYGGVTIVEDCYNASPDSMAAAIKTLASMRCPGKKIAVLSDMGELGPIAEQSHLDTGKLAAGLGIDSLLCTGELSKLYVEGAMSSGLDNARHFPTKDGLTDYLVPLLSHGDIVWFKASRSMRLETVLERVYKELDN